MTLLIRRTRPEDAALARALRLRALASDPLSFGASYEAEVVRDDGFWLQSATRHAASEECAIFIAFRGDEAVGIVRGARDDSRPGVFFIHSMWVAPKARGRGVARALLSTVEEWIALHGGSLCELMVTDAANAARRLYARAGYIADGYSEPSRHVGVMEYRMQKRLSRFL